MEAMGAAAQRHVEELDRRGYTTIRRAVEPALVDELRAAFDGYLGAVRARDAPLTEEWVVPASAEPGDRVSVTTRLGESHAFFVPQGAAPGTVLQYPSRSGHAGDTLEGNGRLQETERFTLNLPWLPPFSDAAVSEHPLVLAILERYWGEADFSVGCLHVNCPMPGALYQRWHRDGGAEVSPATGRTMGIGVKLPLCDANEENGSIEVVPGSHRLQGPVHSYEAEWGGEAPAADHLDYNKLLIDGRFAEAVGQPEHALPPERVNMQRGDIWLMDHRIFHRGTAVNATAPGRPELMFCFRASLFPMPRARAPLSPLTVVARGRRQQPRVGQGAGAVRPSLHGHGAARAEPKRAWRAAPRTRPPRTIKPALTSLATPRLSASSGWWRRF